MIFPIPNTSVNIDFQPDLLQQILAWGLSGAPMPPPDIFKKMTVLQYAKVFEVTSFIETGTFMGTTLRMMAQCGLQCKSIELSEHLYRAAVRDFANTPSVELFHGDSAELLGTMVERATGPYLFWLDGHYSAGDTARGESDTPVMRELAQLLDHDLSRSVILIDDIRDFGKGDYPAVAEILDFVEKHWPSHVCEEAGDILRITPGITLRQRMQAEVTARAA